MAETANCIGVLIPKAEAEDYIRLLLRKDAVRKDLKIEKSGDFILVPLKGNYRVEGYGTLEHVFETRARPRSPSVDVNRELLRLGLPDEFPQAFVRYGKAVMVRPFRGSDDPRVLRVIAEVIGADRIYLLTGRISDDMRHPSVMLAYGEPGILRHRENGITYCFDPQRVMFSPGNVNERVAAADLAAAGSTVFDMFSGIGYFSLPIAKYSRAARVYCTDINPDAIEFLRMSASINNVSSVIEAFNRNCLDYTPGAKVDIAVMGNFKSLEYVDHAYGCLKDSGTLILHFLLDTSRISEIERYLLDRLSYLPAALEVSRKRIVKSYAPNQWHISASVRVRKDRNP